MYNGGNTTIKYLPNITNKNKFMQDILTSMPVK